MARVPDYSSPSDLAEFAYCPRARYYRQRFGPPTPSPAAVAGAEFHRRALRATRRRAERMPVYLGLLLAGVALALLGVGVLLGA